MLCVLCGVCLLFVVWMFVVLCCSLSACGCCLFVVCGVLCVVWLLFVFVRVCCVLFVVVCWLLIVRLFV